MGRYVVTGSTKGIGEKTAELLRKNGHEVINVDIAGADINTDLGTADGRETVVREVRRRCPEGLDGLVSNAGIASDNNKLSRVLSVNYFGALAVMEGLFGLLELRKGRCVVTVSGSVIYTANNRYRVDDLLLSCGDETRICAFVDTFDPALVDNVIYGSTKVALSHWVRRAAPSWAARGVCLNAVAPGGVGTSIMDGLKYMKSDPEKMQAIPVPAHYAKPSSMAPLDIALPLAFLVQDETQSISGEILFCECGTAALLRPDIFRQKPETNA